MQSPFTFYRGTALNMAADLATTPVSGQRVQACGDCHLCNFGGFATPERRVIVDINDLDETLPAPWEWDVKRLAASFVLAGRHNGHSERRARRGAGLRAFVPQGHGRFQPDACPGHLVFEHRPVVGQLIASVPGQGNPATWTETTRKGSPALCGRARFSSTRVHRRRRPCHQGRSAADLSSA